MSNWSCVCAIPLTAALEIRQVGFFLQGNLVLRTFVILVLVRGLVDARIQSLAIRTRESFGLGPRPSEPSVLPS